MRRARGEDARSIADVHVRTWQHAYRDLLPPQFLAELSVEARERYWQAEIRCTPPDRAPWIADAGGEVAGFASIGPSRDPDAGDRTGELYCIYVLPDCWDRGVGADLLRRAEHDLIAHGYDKATLWVLSANERARRFYEKAGWRVDGSRVERIAGLEMEEVRYRKALEPSRVG